MHLPVPGGVVLAIRGGDAIGGVVDLFRNGERLEDRRIDGPEMRWTMLPPGDYRVSVRCGGARPCAGAGAFVITGGTTARAEVLVRPAHRCELRFSTDGICRRMGVLIAEDDGGREVLRVGVYRPSDSEAVSVLLPEGRLSLVFRTDDGWRGEARVTVPADAAIGLRLTK